MENILSLFKKIFLQEELIEKLVRQKKMGQKYYKSLANAEEKKEAEIFLSNST